MRTGPVSGCRELAGVTVWELAPGMLNAIASIPGFPFASRIALRNDPGPESFVLVTVKVAADSDPARATSPVAIPILVLTSKLLSAPRGIARRPRPRRVEEPATGAKGPLPEGRTSRRHGQSTGRRAGAKGIEARAPEVRTELRAPSVECR